MLITTEDRVEVVYTGPLTPRERHEGRNNVELAGPERWTRSTTKGVGRGAHTVVLSVRGFSGREIAVLHFEANRGDGVYDALGRVAEVVSGPLRHVDDLDFVAAMALWHYCMKISQGQDPEDPDPEEVD